MSLANASSVSCVSFFAEQQFKSSLVRQGVSFAHSLRVFGSTAKWERLKEVSDRKM